MARTTYTTNPGGTMTSDAFQIAQVDRSKA